MTMCFTRLGDSLTNGSTAGERKSIAAPQRRRAHVSESARRFPRAAAPHDYPLERFPMIASSREAGSPREDQGAKPVASRHPHRARSLVLGLVLGTCLTLIAILVIFILSNRQTTPRLTWERFDAAEELWRRRGPRNYNLQVQLSGARQGLVKAEIRNGQVVAMSRDGWSPSQKRTWDYWSAPGLFDMIRQDLENAEHPRQAFGVSDPSQVVLRAEFDAECGYPVRYQREVLGGAADLGWRITKFEVVK